MKLPDTAHSARLVRLQFQTTPRSANASAAPTNRCSASCKVR